MTAMPTAPLISRRLTAAAFARNGGEGQWITLNGVHIQIGKGGKIVSGPAHLVGKPISHLAEHQKGDQVIHRQHGPATVTKVSHIGDGQFAYNVKTAAGKEDLAFGPELSRGGGEPAATAPKASQTVAAKPPAAPVAKPGSLSAAPLPEFSARVQAIADRQPVKFGDKAYISHVMRDAIAEDPSLTEAAFKNKLKAAATAGHVELSRADLSGLHDPPTVAASYVNREPGMDATAMGTGGNYGLPVGTSAHMIRTGIRRHAMSRTDAKPLDVLTFDRSGPAAAVFNAELGPGYELPALGDDRPKEILGEPVTYLMKPMLQVGQVADTDEGRIVITADALEVADKYTRKWIKDGGKPFVPDRHRDFDAKSNLGWIRSTKFDGKTLWGEHALIGKDAKLLAARNDTSVLLRWGFSHGGNVYPLLVEHNAFVPDPKMGGLGGFVALSREGAESEQVPVYSLTFDRGDTGGHWITLEGRHILIPDTAGIVPARVKAEPGALKRFTRANLEKAITDHHREKSGESGEYTAGMERELTEAAGDAEDAFRFHQKLPTEIKDAVGENPALRRVFTTTDDAKKAHGSDAYSALGDRYIDITEARAGSPLRQAKAFARSSGDPEAAFVAHVHDNLPAGGTRSLEPVKAGGLKVGDEFTIGGKAHRVAEDEHGFRVLRSHEYGKGDVPLDAVSHVPVDRGSFRRSKVSRRLFAAAGDGIPFSRRLMAFARGDGGVTTGSFGDSGYFREVAGETIFFHGTPGQGFTDSQSRVGKLLTKSGTKTVTVAPHGEGHRVTESGPGAGQHTHADHPTAAAAVADARSRVAGAEANAKSKGEHVATMEKVPGERPGGRYSVRHVVGENGQAAAYLIDHKSGDVMRPAGSIVRHYDSAADAHAVADRMNAREAGAGVPAVSKRLTQAAEAPTTGNPTVDTSRQFGMFAKDAAGNPLEIGEKPGQANLFNASKYDKGSPPKVAPAPKDEPGQMVMPVASTSESAERERIKAVAAWKASTAQRLAIRSQQAAASQTEAAPVARRRPDGHSILHQNGKYSVRPERFGKIDGYGVYEDGSTVATRVGSFSGQGALQKAIDHANRKAAGAPVSARLQAAAAIPGEPAKSAGHVPGGIGGISRDVPGKGDTLDLTSRRRAVGMAMESHGGGPVTVRTTNGDHEYGVEKVGGGYRDYSRHPSGAKLTGKVVDTESGARDVAALKAAAAEAEAVRAGVHIKTSARFLSARMSR